MSTELKWTVAQHPPSGSTASVAWQAVTLAQVSF